MAAAEGRSGRADVPDLLAVRLGSEVVQGNIVHRGDASTVLTVWPPLENVAFIGNFWDADPVGHETPPAGVVLAGNTCLPREGFEAAVTGHPAAGDILERAGLTSAYRHLLTAG